MYFFLGLFIFNLVSFVFHSFSVFFFFFFPRSLNYFYSFQFFQSYRSSFLFHFKSTLIYADIDFSYLSLYTNILYDFLFTLFFFCLSSVYFCHISRCSGILSAFCIFCCTVMTNTTFSFFSAVWNKVRNAPGRITKRKEKNKEKIQEDLTHLGLPIFRCFRFACDTNSSSNQN